MVRFIEMEMPEVGSELLKKVNSSVLQRSSRSQNKNDQISGFLNRLEKAVGKHSQLFRENSLPNFVIKPENISDDYIKGVILGGFAEQLGYERGDLNNPDIKVSILSQFKKTIGSSLEEYSIPLNERKDVVDMVTRTQATGLRTWYDYLVGREAQNVPRAFRYWAMAEMVKLGDYDLVRKGFNERNVKKTAAPFPEFNPQALAEVFDKVQSLSAKDRQNQDFGKLYASSLDHVNSLRLPTERLAVIEGDWEMFPQGAGEIKIKELITSLSGSNTKWCIAGDGYARNYLTHSNLYIYYSKDTDGKNTIPRACIVQNVQTNAITEVRGIMSKEGSVQHLDDYITPKVEEKLAKLDGGREWQETMADMRMLARIHGKHLRKEDFTKDELIFIYQIDRKIKSSGYGTDPRIEEVRNSRNRIEDAVFIKNCNPDRLATEPDKVNKDTELYIGEEITAEIVRLLPPDRIYKSFPDEKVKFKIDTQLIKQTVDNARRKLEDKKVEASNFVKDALDKVDLNIDGEYIIVGIPCSMLMTKNDTKGYLETREVLERAKARGFLDEQTPVGAVLNLATEDENMIQPGDYFYAIGMQTITASDGYPSVFSLRRYVDGELWLHVYWTLPDRHWRSGHRFIFAFRK